jgi:hypothetical protein
MNRRSVLFTGLGAAASALRGAAQQPPSFELRRTGAKPRNVVFILIDDHRYDAMGFLKGQPWLVTPVLDSLARDGVHSKNAFVTTALCSPSRASILTGVYAHRHVSPWRVPDLLAEVDGVFCLSVDDPITSDSMLQREARAMKRVVLESLPAS